MKKMPCIFARDFPADRSERECRDEWTPGCEWVRDGEGVATRKFDGTACAMKDGLADGTYELCGPAVNSNKERMSVHALIRHGTVTFDDAPRTHSGLKEYLSRIDAEGIVFHHPDGRMAKIRRHDFLLPWPPSKDGAMSGE